MMTLREQESFTITWRVKNFSMCPVQELGRIHSPVIQVSQFGNSEWNFHLTYSHSKLVRGRELRGREPGYVACYLHCYNVGVYETAKLRFAMYVVCGETSNLIIESEEKIIPDASWGRGMEYILKDKGKYLPNDILTIKCVMTCKLFCVSKDNEMVDSILKTSCFGETSLYFNKCCCETIVPVHTKRFLRPIRNFLSLSENERITLPLLSAMKKTPSFHVTILKNSKSPITIRVKRKEGIISRNKTLFVKCTVCAVNALKGVTYSLEDQYLFTSEDDMWTLFPPLDIIKLEKDEYFKLNKGILFLQFNFAFSFEGEVRHVDWEAYVPPPTTQCPLEIFTSSNKDAESPVVTLCAGGRNYTVHKALLKTESEVFRAMFENDMKEKKTGVVDIPDVDPQTLGRMISFLYCGTVGDLITKDLGDLYTAANTYQVLSLMDYCSSLLMCSLKVPDVCEILILADLYQNERLLKYIEEFIVFNAYSERLFMSQDWKNLMESHASVAAKFMHKILTR